ncbi:MAG: hypothetical protein LUO79_08660 [Methanomassiliicoccales archaeon]|nr:hypothetical protein [Methanomassiliicoccales archaeon]
MIGSEHRKPSIFVYTGEGASHSWLWLADSMERLGVLDMRFGDFRNEDSSIADVMVISGGDVGRMSRAIGDEGFLSLLRSVKEGGTYVGLCAGAYLPLRSSHSPSRAFHVIDAPISNIASPEGLGSFPRRYVFRCGEREVFQPVRGPVRLSIPNGNIVAPMFGGPCWHDLPSEITLAKYAQLEEGTERIGSQNLVDRAISGKTAALSVALGKGKLLLFGPHAEHPDYPLANAWMLGLLPHGEGQGFGRELALVEPPLAAKRALSNARVALSGLQGREWTIGAKVWEAEKAGLFIDAMWKRLPLLERSDAGVPGEVTAQLGHALDAMRAVRTDPSNEIEANAMFVSLSGATSAFLNHYFGILRHRSG